MKKIKRCPRGCVPVSGGLGAAHQTPEARALWLAKQISKWSPAGRRMQGDELRQWRVRHFFTSLNREGINLTSEDYKRLTAVVIGRKLLPGFAPVDGLGSISDGTPLDDFEARDLLYQWHGGGGSGVYQVASMMDHGVPPGAYERARGELAYARRHEQEREAMGRRRSGWLTGPTPVEELDALIAWLDGKIGGGLGAARSGPTHVCAYPLCTKGIRGDKEYCAEHEGAGGEPSEPEEGDIITEDHQHWYQHDKLYFTGDEAGLRAKMEQDKFWPNVWFVSDHGNAHLISV